MTMRIFPALFLGLGACLLLAGKLRRGSLSGGVSAAFPGEVSGAEGRTPEPVFPSGRVPVALSAASGLEGVCTDAGGRPIVPAPRILVTDERGRQFLRATDANGHYRIGGLAPGDVRVECRADGFVPGLEELQLEGEIPNNLVDFVLERQRVVEVRWLTPEGRSFPQEAARLGLGGPRLPELVVRTGGQELPIRPFPPGSWSFHLPEGATATLLARLGGVELGRARIAPGATRAELILSCLTLRAQLARLEVRVRSVEHTELGGASAWLRLAGGRIEAASGPGGAFTLAECPCGSAELWLTAAGHELLGLEVRLEPGARLDLGEIPLCPGRTVSGLVTDGVGHPRRAFLTVIRADRGDAIPRHVASRADGRFEIADLAAGRWRLAPVGEETALEFDLGDGPRNDLRLVLGL